jgi:hypothetical protein
VPSPLGYLSGCDATVEPGGDAGVAQVVGQRRSGPPTVTLVAHGGQNTLSKASMGVRPDHGRFIVTRMHREGTADLAMPLDEAQAISELASELKRMAL